MENYDFEMPTPCQHCGEIFDLNDGFGSEKWYPNTVICEECYRKEEEEIEEDERWETVNNELSNALYGLDKEDGAWDKLSDENRALILHIVNRRYSPEEGKVRGGSTIKWETFTDESYHNMIAVRPIGDTDFNSPRLFHFIFPENAEKFKLLAEMAFIANPNGG